MAVENRSEYAEFGDIEDASGQPVYHSTTEILTGISAENLAANPSLAPAGWEPLIQDGQIVGFRNPEPIIRGGEQIYQVRPVGTTIRSDTPPWVIDAMAGLGGFASGNPVVGGIWGALAGQVIGGDTEGTLQGLGAGIAGGSLGDFVGMDALAGASAGSAAAGGAGAAAPEYGIQTTPLQDPATAIGTPTPIDINGLPITSIPTGSSPPPASSPGGVTPVDVLPYAAPAAAAAEAIAPSDEAAKSPEQIQWEQQTGNVPTYQPETSLGSFVDDPMGSIGKFLSESGVSWDQFTSNPDAYIADLVARYGQDALNFFKGDGTSTGAPGTRTPGGFDMGNLLALLGTGAAIGSALNQDYGAADTLPEWYKPYAEDILSRSKAESERPYQPYTGDLIAGRDPNEIMAWDLARLNAERFGGEQPDFIGEAAGYVRRGGATLPETDIEGQYMNPWIKGALDPTARELTQRWGIDRERLLDRPGGWGSRTSLLEGEMYGQHQQALSDLYGKGYAQAYDTGVRNWQSDMGNLRATGGALASLGSNWDASRTSALAGLSGTGALGRGIEQANLGADYEQFLEQRDWSGEQMDDYARRVASVRSGEELQPKDRTSAIIGALTAGAGLAKSL